MSRELDLQYISLTVVHRAQIGTILKIHRVGPRVPENGQPGDAEYIPPVVDVTWNDLRLPARCGGV